MSKDSPTPETFDRAASTKNANMQRDQWAEYQKTTVPIENKMLQVAGDGPQTTFNGAGIAQASKGVDTAFGNAASSESRDRARLGQGINPLQAQAMTINNDIAKTTSAANAVNTATEEDRTRRNNMMTTGIGGASSTVGIS